MNSVLVQEGNVTITNSSATAANLAFSDATPDFRVETGASATVNVGITNSTYVGDGDRTTEAWRRYVDAGWSGDVERVGRQNPSHRRHTSPGCERRHPEWQRGHGIIGRHFRCERIHGDHRVARGRGAVTLGGGTLIEGGDNTSTFFNGTMTGGGIFQKTGTGTFSLGANLSYNGEFKLSGGTLALNGFDLTTKNFHVTANSILDFGSNLSSILSTTTFLIDSGVTLTVNNWVDTVDFFYAANNPGGSQGTAPLNQIVFAGFTGGATRWQSFDHQIAPVPEPATYGALLIGGMLGFFGLRRWRRA